MGVMTKILVVFVSVAPVHHARHHTTHHRRAAAHHTTRTHTSKSSSATYTYPSGDTVNNASLDEMVDYAMSH